MRLIRLCLLLFIGHVSAQTTQKTDFVWQGANMYFLLVDRFHNADKTNDTHFDRTKTAAPLRGFEGGDLKGITAKINEGYFTKLGINAIWLTPITEQIHGGTDEGTGITYGFHGYWTRDWTAIDPNFGTEEDLAELVETAHKNGIRILLDAVINHTGPVTKKDPVWPEDWVRTSPVCSYQNYETTVTCTLVENLPDIKTESDIPVALPNFLVKKWQEEGRYEREKAELDAFFATTGYPRAPRFYIIKWLTDYIRKFGIDGYRVDTVKHTEEGVWGEFKSQCNAAFWEWKTKNPSKVLDENDFFLLGEVYNFGLAAAPLFDFGDRKVNYFDFGFNNLINFDFKSDATLPYEDLFSKYNQAIHGPLEGYGITNYISSHDDSHPFDADRKKTFESATKLLLTPGISQIYYGDESARMLSATQATGDAKLRSFMNWGAHSRPSTAKLLEHWQKLGQFRANHPAVGAGVHKVISKTPYVFSRGFDNGRMSDRVVVALDMPSGVKRVSVKGVFKDGTLLRDAYSGRTSIVSNGTALIHSDFGIVLLEEKKH